MSWYVSNRAQSNIGLFVQKREYVYVQWSKWGVLRVDRFG